MNKYLLIILFFSLTLFSYSQIDTTERAINNPETDTAKTSEGSDALPIFSSNTDNVAGQDVAALLGSSRDIFYQAMIFHVISANFRYNLRGYSQNNFSVNIFGLRINNLLTGTASFTTWGGMSDVYRVMQTKPGLGASRYAFGDIGGNYNLPISASSFRKGFRVAYTQGNRIFKERLSISYGTGMSKKGWAFAITSTLRYAAKSYVPGTSMSSLAYFVGIDKKFNDKNTLSLIVFGAPRNTARTSLNTDEAYALTGDKHYNPNWGYQSGQVRNVSNSFSHLPTAILTDNITINDHSKLTVNGLYSFGRTSVTAFNYYGAGLNPLPTYYKYMPSYFGPTSTDADPGQFASQTSAWQNNTANGISGFSTSQQVAWDDLYNTNSKNLQTTYNVDGIAGKTYTGNRSLYIVEDRRTDTKNWAVNAIYNTRTKNNIFLTGGLNGGLSQTRYYKVVNDLLGGDYWLDLNQFAVPSTNPNVYQYNINDPNKIIKKGDVFGYDYNINVTRAEAWGQAEKSFKKFDVYAGASISTTSFYRDGHMINGLFPSTTGGDGSSGGRSKNVDFLNYGVKGGITYKINGHNYITVNLISETKPPLPTTAFVSPHSRNDVIPGLKNEKVLSGDITYNIRWRWLRGRITYYCTQMNNQSWLRSYYDDIYKTMVNYYMTNVNQLNQGVELGLEAIVTKRVSIIGALNYGSYLYTNRPSASISADNSAALLSSNRTIYLKNYHVGGAPEVVSSLGVRYTGKKSWYVGVYLNYFANNYVTINPDRRTAEALAKYIPADPQVAQITDQEKLKNVYTLDFMAGKSFVINKNRLNFSLIMNNITNNIFKTIGQEQLRHDVSNITKFPNQYAYSYGITFYASVSFTF